MKDKLSLTFPYDVFDSFILCFENDLRTTRENYHIFLPLSNEELFVIHAFTLISYMNIHNNWLYILFEKQEMQERKENGNCWDNAVDDKIRK